MSKKKKDNLLIGLIILAVLISLYTGGFFSFFEYSPLGPIQFVGTLSGQYDPWFQSFLDRGKTVTQSDTAQIFEYTIKTQKSDYQKIGVGDCVCEAFNIVNSPADFGFPVDIGASNWADESFTSSCWSYGCQGFKWVNDWGISPWVVTRGIDSYGCPTQSYSYKYCSYGVYSSGKTSCAGNWIEDHVGEGGCKFSLWDEGYGCWGQYSIYKNDVLLQEIGWTRQQKVVNLEDLKIVFGYSSHIHEANHCGHIDNTFLVMIPQGSIGFNVSVPIKQTFVGQQVFADIITYNYWRPTKGELMVHYEIPTAIGSAEKTESKFVDIPLGKSVHTYSIPTEQVTDIVRITPELHILATATDFSGLNMLCYADKKAGINEISSVTSCQYTELGIFWGDTHEIQINPKPLWTNLENGMCPTGYQLSFNEQYCIRTDVMSLTCMQIGCPIIPDHDYVCTSSGLCAEVIYMHRNCTTEGCPTGYSCDPQTYVCIEDHVYQEIGDCTTYLDCYIPCQGMTVQCIIPNLSQTGYCKYSGTCLQQQIDCRDVGCMQGSKCVLQDTNYICLKDCTTQPCPTGYRCNEQKLCESITQPTPNPTIWELIQQIWKAFITIIKNMLG